MKKVLFTTLAVLMLAGTAAAQDMVRPKLDLTPNKWNMQHFGEHYGCNVFGTTMSNNWRLYSVLCGYGKDIHVGVDDNCKPERLRSFSGYRSIRFSCTGPYDRNEFIFEGRE